MRFYKNTSNYSISGVPIKGKYPQGVLVFNRWQLWAIDRRRENFSSSSTASTFWQQRTLMERRLMLCPGRDLPLKGRERWNPKFGTCGPAVQVLTSQHLPCKMTVHSISIRGIFVHRAQCTMHRRYHTVYHRLWTLDNCHNPSYMIKNSYSVGHNSQSASSVLMVCKSRVQSVFVLISDANQMTNFLFILTWSSSHASKDRWSLM